MGAGSGLDRLTWGTGWVAQIKELLSSGMPKKAGGRGGERVWKTCEVTWSVGGSGLAIDIFVGLGGGFC